MGKDQQSPDKIGISTPFGKSNRVIIVHSGKEVGYVKDTFLIFTAKQKSSNYNDSMIFIHFSKWEKWLLNLPSRSVIFLNNTAYLNVEEDKKPTSNALIVDIQNWLKRNGVQSDSKITKAEFLMLVKGQLRTPVYKIDSLLHSHRHKVLCFPLYHLDLNSIELVWGGIKRQVSQRY